MYITKTIAVYVLFILFIIISNATLASTTLQTHIDKLCTKNCIEADALTDIVTRTVEGTKLDFRLILAIIRVESKFRLTAKNNSTEGLMQVHKRIHAKAIKGNSLFNPSVNIRVGVSILNHCYKRNIRSGIRKVLSCYNGGGDGTYANKVLTALSKIKSIKVFTAQQFFNLEGSLHVKTCEDIRSRWMWDQPSQEIDGIPGKGNKVGSSRGLLRRYELFEFISVYTA